LSWSSPAKTTAVASCSTARQALFDLRSATPGIDGPATSMIMKSARRWQRNATSRNLI
jgi:hypothetical protein